MSPRNHQVSLRPLPYPYRAALAICSDIDETQDSGEFLEIQRFLNTKSSTSMGTGVGLEIGNSFYFYDDDRHFSYFTGDERSKRVIEELIQAGYIDCLHTYGDAAMTRDDALRALDALNQADCRLDVWVNHFGAPSNLCHKFEYMMEPCSGDDPSSTVYHADVTLQYGIRFVWVGATTRMIGQAPSHSRSALATVLDRNHPVASGLSILKEIRKNALGRFGDERYIMQSKQQLMAPLQLADGQQVHEFARYCNHPAGVGYGATSRGLAYTIREAALEHLKARGGFMIVYTHLGKNSECDHVIAPETQIALRRLEDEYQSGQIYVTTTSKLLNYFHNYRCAGWNTQLENGRTRIEIGSIEDPVFGNVNVTPHQLQGLTFYVDDRRKTDIYVADVEVKDLQRNPADDTGRESVTVPFTRLRFPY